MFCLNPGYVVTRPGAGQPGDGQGLANEASSMLLYPGGPSDGCL